MRSTSTRLKISPQLSSSAMRMPAACAAAQQASRSGSPSGNVASRSMPAKRAKASATVSRSGAANGSAARPRKVNCCVPAACAACAKNRGAVGHQRLIRLAGPIPFDQREFRRVQRAALAIAKHSGELDDTALASRKELLAGEFRRRAQVKRRRRAIRRHQLGGEGVQMRLVAGRDLQRAGLDLDEIVRGEPGAQARRRSGRAPAGRAAGRHGRGGPRRATTWAWLVRRRAALPSSLVRKRRRERRID